MEYILSTERSEFKPLQENKSIFVFCHSSSGHKHAVSEILSDPNITSRLTDTKAAGEVKALGDFYTMLKNEPSRAFYGPAQCIAASSQEAIDALMVTGAVTKSFRLGHNYFPSCNCMVDQSVSSFLLIKLILQIVCLGLQI